MKVEASRQKYWLFPIEPGAFKIINKHTHTKYKLIRERVCFSADLQDLQTVKCQCLACPAHGPLFQILQNSNSTHERKIVASSCDKTVTLPSHPPNTNPSKNNQL